LTRFLAEIGANHSRSPERALTHDACPDAGAWGITRQPWRIEDVLLEREPALNASKDQAKARYDAVWR
jgi:hypothetical protein